MVKEKRIIVSVRDVLQLRLVCRFRNNDESPCGGEMLFQFGNKMDELRCPRCSEPWFTKFPDNMPPEMRQVPPKESANIAMIKAFETLTSPGCGQFEVHFEIDGEDD